MAIRFYLRTVRVLCAYMVLEYRVIENFSYIHGGIQKINTSHRGENSKIGFGGDRNWNTRRAVGRPQPGLSCNVVLSL